MLYFVQCSYFQEPWNDWYNQPVGGFATEEDARVKYCNLVHLFSNGAGNFLYRVVERQKDQEDRVVVESLV